MKVYLLYKTLDETREKCGYYWSIGEAYCSYACRRLFPGSPSKGGRGYFEHKFFGAGQFRQALKQPFACRPEQPKAILCPPRIDRALVILNSPDTPCKIFFASIIRHCPADEIAPPSLNHAHNLRRSVNKIVLDN